MKPNILVVLRLAEHILALPVTGLVKTTSVLQYSNIIVNILRAICNMPICHIVTALMTSSVYTTAHVYQHHCKLINPCSLFLSTNGLECSLLSLQGLCIWQWNFFFSSLHVAFSQEPWLLKAC